MITIPTTKKSSGTSSTFTGSRRPKTDMLFQALGGADELTSFIGLAAHHVRDFALTDIANTTTTTATSEIHSSNLVERLERVQCIIQVLCSHIATPRSEAAAQQLAKTPFEADYVVELEEWIDEMDAILPPLSNFILPSGGLASSTLHVARCVCRRAERQVLELHAQESLDTNAVKYINRLSDFLFTAARVSARMEGAKETIYRPPTARGGEAVKRQ